MYVGGPALLPIGHQLIIYGIQSEFLWDETRYDHHLRACLRVKKKKDSLHVNNFLN